MRALVLSISLVCIQTMVPARAETARDADIERLIDQLGSDEFTERQEASKRLDSIGERALPALRKALATSNDVEIRHRARQLIQAMGERVFAQVRRIAWQDPVQHIPAHIYHTAFSPDGRSYLAGGDIGPIRLWDVATGKELQELKGHEGWTCQAVFTPDGKRVLSGGVQDKLLRLWNVASGQEVRTFAGHTAEVASVAISPDGRFALSGSADQSLRLWDLATGQEMRRLEGHAGTCGGIFSADGKQVLSFSADKTVRLWDAGTGKQVQVLKGHTEPVCGAFFIPGGRQVVSYASDNTLRAWDLAGGKEVWRHSLGTDHCAIRWLAITPDGRRFLTNHQDFSIRLHDLATGRELHRHEVPPEASPQGLSLGPDGRYAACGSYRGFVYLFRLGQDKKNHAHDTKDPEKKN